MQRLRCANDQRNMEGIFIYHPTLESVVFLFCAHTVVPCHGGDGLIQLTVLFQNRYQFPQPLILQHNRRSEEGPILPRQYAYEQHITDWEYDESEQNIVSNERDLYPKSQSIISVSSYIE
jgi:hypothetical protein